VQPLDASTSFLESFFLCKPLKLKGLEDILKTFENPVASTGVCGKLPE
jgi:hypothetical protein